MPHAGLLVDPRSLATLVAPARSIGRDADLYVDELYGRAAELGATLIVAHASRYVCDLNRAETDVDSRVAESGTEWLPHGLVWWTTTEGDRALAGPLAAAELERRRATFHRPYHAAVAEALAAKRARFGFAILLCAHSMPSQGRAGHADSGRVRADVVPGSRGRTSADPRVIDLVDQVARDAGLVVAHDDPYKGGFSTGHYGRPAESLHAIQIELARRLYMDETSLLRRPRRFRSVRELADAFVARLGSLDLR
ncbi:MAG: N-formylglutamate amidohydrolase [Polyangiaceae bacterium]|nr:N-formylglutamate amidohydrolase [Polyangiaceae bacterium]